MLTMGIADLLNFIVRILTYQIINKVVPSQIEYKFVNFHFPIF